MTPGLIFSSSSTIDIGTSGAMTTIKGTLNVDEAVTLDSTLDVTGEIHFKQSGYGGYLLGQKYITQNIDEVFLRTATGVTILRCIDHRTTQVFNQQIYLGASGSVNQLFFFGVQYTTSDDRFKHQEIDITNGLSLIRQLNPQKYKKTGEKKDVDYNGELEDDTWHWESGLIAQDILQIQDLSYCVQYNSEDDIYFLNYDDIFTTNIAATKELDAIVQTQQSTITELNTKVNNLEAENDLIKSKLNELLAEAGKSTI